jgi:glycosyltransferase involved in cell wall biosynthesis
VVSTPVGHAPELLKDGAAGLLFALDDSCALSTAVETILNSPEVCARMKQSARNVAVQSLGLHRTQQKVIELIRNELH